MQGEISMKIGTRVKVCPGSGLESGTIGIVIPNREIPTNGRGVPLITGYYHPITKKDIAIRTNSGRLLTMFRNRLSIV